MPEHDGLSMTTLAGILVVRNGLRLDYCWEIAGQALLEFCDELVLCDCDSDDGTRERIDEWAARDKRITVCNFPWTDPRGDNTWFPTWQNYARQHAKSEWVIFTDADEVVHEDSYRIIRDAAQSGKALKCRRLNFWRDAQHLIPEGFCCGSEVIRVGSQKMWIPSDYPDPRANEIMGIAEPCEATFYHYGFLRKRDSFFKKAREVQRIWANDYDKRLEAAETYVGQWGCMPGVTGWENDVQFFFGNHPKIAQEWLSERGYNTHVMTPEELISKWQHVLNDASHIFTWTEPASLAYCCEIASRSKFAVETGVYMGASAFCALRSNPELHLWAVDTFQVAGTEKTSRYFLRKEIEEGRCELIVGSSDKAGEMLQHMKGKIDSLMCDDGHAEEDLVRDLTHLYPLLRAGGHCYGHDWEGDNDVARGVKRIFPMERISVPVPRMWAITKP